MHYLEAQHDVLMLVLPVTVNEVLSDVAVFVSAVLLPLKLMRCGILRLSNLVPHLHMLVDLFRGFHVICMTKGKGRGGCSRLAPSEKVSGNFETLCPKNRTRSFEHYNFTSLTTNKHYEKPPLDAFLFSYYVSCSVL